MTNGDKKTSLIEWIEVNKRPNNASYILLKIIEPEYKETICIPGSYEDGRFWDVVALSHIEIDKECIVGWSYYPYDDRL